MSHQRATWLQTRAVLDLFVQISPSFQIHFRHLKRPMSLLLCLLHNYNNLDNCCKHTTPKNQRSMCEEMHKTEIVTQDDIIQCNTCSMCKTRQLPCCRCSCDTRQLPCCSVVRQDSCSAADVCGCADTFCHRAANSTRCINKTSKTSPHRRRTSPNCAWRGP